MSTEKNIQVSISDPILVHAPKMNDAIAKWGVYAIPRLWRNREGELIVRLNGEMDTADEENMQQAPNLYFVSRDDGDTWELVENGEERYDITVITGINPPYITRRNGDRLAVKYKKNLSPIRTENYISEYIMPNHAEKIQIYRYGEIPAECKGFCLEVTKAGTNATKEFDIDFDFPEREVLIVSHGMAVDGSGKYVPVEKYMHPYIFKSNYFSGLTELLDGTLAALCYGQNPAVSDRCCQEVYLVVSQDDGITWRKRGTVASGIDEVPYGYGGDSGEISLTMASNGDLLCVMRMDMSVNPNEAQPICDAMYCISKDGGYTWSKPVSVADSSVTPHMVGLADGIVVCIYGRPGVHMKYSADNGETWSKSYPIIGKTLEEERAAGRSDADSKYFDTVSYSNTFVEKIDENTVLVLYTDVKYCDGSGRLTKASLVKKIRITK